MRRWLWRTGVEAWEIASLQADGRAASALPLLSHHLPNPFPSLDRMYMQSTLSPSKASLGRRPSSRKRAGSHLPPHQSQESHDHALQTIRTFLKSRSCYDAFPISFRLIVLDTKLNVKKALQCLLYNSEHCYAPLPLHTDSLRLAI